MFKRKRRSWQGEANVLGEKNAKKLPFGMAAFVAFGALFSANGTHAHAETIGTTKQANATEANGAQAGSVTTDSGLSVSKTPTDEESKDNANATAEGDSADSQASAENDVAASTSSQNTFEDTSKEVSQKQPETSQSGSDSDAKASTSIELSKQANDNTGNSSSAVDVSGSTESTSFDRDMANYPAKAMLAESKATNSIQSTTPLVKSAEKYEPQEGFIAIPQSGTAKSSSAISYITASDGKAAEAPAVSSYVKDSSSPAWTSVDSKTGAVTASPTSNIAPGVYTVAETINYADGSKGAVETTVLITTTSTEPNQKGVFAFIGSQKDLDDYLAKTGTDWSRDRIFLANTENLKLPKATYTVADRYGTPLWFLTPMSKGDIDFNGSTIALATGADFSFNSTGSHQKADGSQQEIKNGYIYGSGTGKTNANGSITDAGGMFRASFYRSSYQKLSNLHFYNAQGASNHIFDIMGCDYMTVEYCEFAGLRDGDISDADLRARDKNNPHQNYAEAVQIDSAIQGAAGENEGFSGTWQRIWYAMFSENQKDGTTTTNLTIKNNVFSNYKGKTGDAIINGTNETVYDKYGTGTGSHTLSPDNARSNSTQAVGIDISNNIFTDTIADTGYSSVRRLYYPVHENILSGTADKSKYRRNQTEYSVHDNQFVNMATVTKNDNGVWDAWDVIGWYGDDSNKSNNTSDKLTDVFEAEYSNAKFSTKVGEKVASSPVTFKATNGVNVTMPANTTFSLGSNASKWTSIDKATGELTISPVDDVSAGSYTIPVIVTYSDNTTDAINVAVSVAAKENQPSGNEGSQSVEDNKGNRESGSQTSSNSGLGGKGDQGNESKDNGSRDSQENGDITTSNNGGSQAPESPKDNDTDTGTAGDKSQPSDDPKQGNNGSESQSSDDAKDDRHGESQSVDTSKNDDKSKQESSESQNDSLSQNQSNNVQVVAYENDKEQASLDLNDGKESAEKQMASANGSDELLSSEQVPESVPKETPETSVDVPAVPDEQVPSTSNEETPEKPTEQVPESASEEKPNVTEMPEGTPAAVKLSKKNNAAEQAGTVPIAKKHELKSGKILTTQKQEKQEELHQTKQEELPQTGDAPETGTALTGAMLAASSLITSAVSKIGKKKKNS